MPKKSKKEPRNYLPLFVDDLENEESLKLVSDTAWKLWVRMIAYMWCKSPKQGFMLTKAGTVPTDDELALIFSLPKTVLLSCAYELERERVFDRDRSGAIVCRRQIQEAKLSRIRSKAGARGVEKKRLNFAQAKGEANTSATPGGGGGDPIPSLIPDLDPEKSTHRAIGSPKKSDPPSVDPERGVELWREVCVSVGLADVRKLDSERRKKFAARMRERDAGQPRDEAWLRAYLQRIAASDFCRGMSSSKWVADFDFAFSSEKTVLKVLEGKYDNRGASGPAKRANGPIEIVRSPTGEHNRKAFQQFLDMHDEETTDA